MKKLFKLLTSLLMFTVLLVSCGTEKKEAKKAGKVAIVFSTGGLGDKSFNDSANEGLLKAAKELNVEYDYYEPKDASSETKNQLSNYAEKGDYDMIFAIGATAHDALLEVAKEFPEQKFTIVDSEVDLPNVASILFKEQEGSYLVGALSAMMTKTNSLGFVGGMDIDVIKRFQSGFEQGAKAVNPDINITVVFVNGSNPFNDPVTAKSLTTTMIDNKKTDIIFPVAGGSGAGVFQAAKEKGVFALGVDLDQDGIMPGIILTSMIKKVNGAVYQIVKDVLNDNFKTGVKHLGIAEEGVATSEFKYTKDIIGQEKIDKINKLSKDIKDGKVKVEGIEYLKK
ncbi:BMP family lipoprotein [Oceanivirga miroungae]|uniref:Basic membrane lipoprotein n=1 Tax=Oceanivirga miroungae TaxID=1130046 RepID=A0A6I8MDU2_9FUSO|nr:BMP family ABC transporter substrate-binding protein [Oceanivirga miroungae]VWL85344.1 basic membrane lipoprotein [Oceanivirga miroungae]